MPNKEDHGDFLDKEVEYARALCYTWSGRITPEIKWQQDFLNKYTYNDVEGEEHTAVMFGSPVVTTWSISGDRPISGMPVATNLTIHVGPHRSLLRCITEWNQAIQKLIDTTFAPDLFKKEKK